MAKKGHAIKCDKTLIQKSTDKNTRDWKIPILIIVKFYTSGIPSRFKEKYVTDVLWIW